MNVGNSFKVDLVKGLYVKLLRLKMPHHVQIIGQSARVAQLFRFHELV